MKKQTAHKLSRIAAVLGICTLSISLTGCAHGQNTTPVSMNGFFFDTAVTVTLYQYEGNSADIFAGVNELCSGYDSLLSATKPGSDIWNINHADDYPVVISDETYDLISCAISYCDIADGQLDITIGGLVESWNFSEQSGSASPVIPDSQSIQEIVNHIDYHNIILQKDASGKSMISISDPNTDIELGCIAKGYIADKIDEYLKTCNVTSALISLGGNIKTIGHKPDGSDFKIGIQKPFAAGGETITTITVSDTSVVSSGVYERYFISDNQLYNHILDPKSGYPVNNGVYGVSVIAENSMAADALSTLCFILGPDEGCRLIETLGNTEVLFIMSDDSLIKSSGWK